MPGLRHPARREPRGGSEASWSLQGSQWLAARRAEVSKLSEPGLAVRRSRSQPGPGLACRCRCQSRFSMIPRPLLPHAWTMEQEHLRTGQRQHSKHGCQWPWVDMSRVQSSEKCWSCQQRTELRTASNSSYTLQASQATGARAVPASEGASVPWLRQKELGFSLEALQPISGVIGLRAGCLGGQE